MRLLSVAILSIAMCAGVRAADQTNKKDDPNQIGDRDVGKCLNFYSLSKEMAWGKQLADEVARESKIDDDALLSEYVNRIGQNLARNSDAKVPFTFRVIDGEEMNAFALPGGYVFVYTGLIKLASDEDEFAGALSHEIAHVAARHMTCRASQQKAAGIAIPVIGVFTGGIGGMAAQKAAGMTFLSFSRHDESEADYLGVQYMYAAGYDPTGVVGILEKLETLQKTKPGAVARVLATHPMDSQRIERTEQEIGRILPAKSEYIITTSEYRDMRDRLINREAGRKPQTARPTLKVRSGDDPVAPDEGDKTPTVKRRNHLQ